MRRIWTALIVLLACSCSHFNPNRIRGPRPAVVSSQLTYPEIIEHPLVFPYNDDHFWITLFSRDKRLGGITLCYGKNSSLVKINPFISSDLQSLSLRHEFIHVQQNTRYGCNKILGNTNNPRWRIRLEAEAYSRTENLHGDELLGRLMMYPYMLGVSKDTLREWVKEYY